MPEISCLNQKIAFSAPVTVLGALSRFAPNPALQPLGAFCKGKVLELNDVLSEDCEITPIDFSHDEGRRIYERSLRFILLLAAHRCFPSARVRIEHSIGYGLYLQLNGKTVVQGDAELLEAAMRSIVAENLPFERTLWPLRQAVDYFKGLGWLDKAGLLSCQKQDPVPLYHCGELNEYFYGAMLPSTSYVSAFSVIDHAPGLILQMPSPEAPAVPAPYVSRPKHMAAFYESNAWCRILDCRNAGDLNRLIEQQELREFIRVNEALHDKSLSVIAEEIRNRSSRVIFLAGPSSSGKTTTANRLKIHLRVLGIRPELISMDDFYKNREDSPRDAQGNLDLESLYALDLPHFRSCIRRLLDGETVEMPRYDFPTGARCAKGVPMRLEKDQMLIIEGIHGLNPLVHEGFSPDEICKVYLSELTCLNLDDHNRIRTTDARMLRRIVRDYQFRGTSPEKTLTMWDSVHSGEMKWIFPYQEQADIVFNSALHYELPVLKTLAYDLLSRIPANHPQHYRAEHLLRMLDYFIPAQPTDMAEIPPLSILREFIGGNTLYN